ncbi:hypothetical protein [Saccharomonospora iraqiensis]|uniref:hypothetical protein n=1 Tax=Saccharomonospora iraqiensis TaxID=52698 RepID=UPI000479FC62|nr:hypothetical protein [Saccharomonospora iraqiensis]
MDASGWTLRVATTHGLRVWSHHNGDVRMFGLNAMANETLTSAARHLEALAEATRNGEDPPPVIDPAISPERLAELVMNDAYVLTDGWYSEGTE